MLMSRLGKPPPDEVVMRRAALFVVAYLGASLVATAAVLVVQSAQVLTWGLGLEAFHDFLATALFYSVYGLLFTLVLGVPGWLLLMLAGWNGALPYAIVGAALGLVAATYFAVFGGPGPGMELLYGFPVAGLAAALTFRSLYYRRDHPRSPRGAAA
jgi:hypothetical protein